ncbi:MAG: flagellar filament capping protein FliD, partial [Gammaproteobacteria bacterium]|nr:flagellar filament capping protein FliD [Gammaproteobacteria bacterium]
DNDELTVAINGTSSGIINLTQGVYASKDDMAAEIQSQINSDSVLKAAGHTVTVSYDATNDRFQIESDTFGSDSLVEILTVDTNSSADFGLAASSAVAGVDVAGSIGGVLATGSGQTLTLENGDGDELSIDVKGGSLGDRGSLRFTRGLIDQLNTLMNSYLDSTDGIIAAREDGLNASLEDISDDRVSLDFRMESVEARLIKQFTALDGLIAQFQTTGNFLAQQIDSLPGSGQLLNSK